MFFLSLLDPRTGRETAERAPARALGAGMAHHLAIGLRHRLQAGHAQHGGTGGEPGLHADQRVLDHDALLRRDAERGHGALQLADPVAAELVGPLYPLYREPEAHHVGWRGAPA